MIRNVTNHRDPLHVAIPPEKSRAVPEGSETSFRKLLSGRISENVATGVRQGTGSPVANSGTAASQTQSTPSLLAVFTPKIPSSSTPASSAQAPQASTQTAAPTPQSVFGDQVWSTSPCFSAPDNSVHAYNPIYFASASTAAQVAKMVGGTVISMNAMASNGVMLQSEPNLMVKLPNGKIVNPGLIADFYNHGYPQSYVDMLVQNEIRGDNT